MANGGADAINVLNYPDPGHKFNFNVVGEGGSFFNLSQVPERCLVEITAGVPAPGNFMSVVAGVDCLVSTGNRVTIFQGEIARELELPVIQWSVQRRWVPNFL